VLWFSLSLLSAASKAANQVITKSLTRDFSVLQIAAFGQFSAGLLIFPLLFIPDFVAVPASLPFHKAASATIAINVIAILLLVEAINRSELSYALPLLGLTPVFTIVTGWLLRGEIINLSGVLGILLVFFGTFGIDARSFNDWITLGGRRIFRDKGVLLVILVAFLYSISSVYDKSATLLSDPVTFVWYSAVIRASILMLIYSVGKRSSRTAVAGSNASGKYFLLFTLLGISFTAEALFQMFALQTGLVAYIIAIKRISILLTSLAGMTVYKEAFSRARLFGTVLVVAGAAFIYLA